MTNMLLRSLAAIGLISSVAACSRSDAAPRDAAKAPAAAAAPATASVTTAATANGAITPGAVPHDSISDRADRGRIAGDPAATIWVIMASDFQCPYCKQWHDAAFAPVMQDYASKGKVRLAFINFPLGMHPNAMPAAEAAMCASVQGKFWQMHDALFATQDEWAPMPNAASKFDALVTVIGVDMAQWRNCVAKHLTAPLIQADRDRVRGAGVQSTPTFFVDGKMITAPDGVSSAGASSDVKAAIEAALKSKAPR